ncbi:sensor histidine kinase [Enterococcus phoeniculicola]|uniref:Sensor histidine kinase NatK-like C-terminal domain-containing protein n=1 Tax=Enterococcus phoeniculicola ATCC BAA-412 TaxID=1158610 RepID=R3W5V8_9ENTE|nr:GHKL domain-containing protein [Enterococcus phoeniculicola]EOL43036.1 hypothetical protein UC3_02013 [Enterococcus phoeniculicola ATCC BAA-412]EOT76606.1 hypothetical protein I589_01563 [Enterococcus phoeniculicola ATCC BAA-412]
MRLLFSRVDLILLLLEYICISFANGLFLSLLKDPKYLIRASVISIICTFLFTQINVMSSVFFWLFLALYSMLNTKKIYSSLFGASLAVILYVVTNYIFGYFLSLVIPKANLSLFLIIPINFIIYLICTCTIVYFWNKMNLSLITNSLQLISLLSVVTVIGYFYIIIYEKLFGKVSSLGHSNLFFISFYGIAFSFISIFAVHLIKKDNEQKRKQKEQQYLEEYFTNLEHANIEIRRFKHDYQNILLSMQEYFNQNDMDGLRRFYETDILATLKILDQGTLNLSKVTNLEIPEIKSLIVSKVLQAQGKNIEVFIEIPEVIVKIGMNKIDLIRCLGIILDNAIEENEDTKNGWIKIGFIKVKDILKIIVENSCLNTKPPLYKLKEEGYSTKGINRGIGLKILNDLISKTDMATLETKIEADTFIQIINIKGEL